MGLTIELSFDLHKHKNVTELKQLLSNLAEKYNSNTNYFIHEIEGRGTLIDRNECIQIIEFEIEPIEQMRVNILKYIKDIIQNEILTINCIYVEKGKCNLIYASRKYLLLTPNKPKPKAHHKINNILEIVSKELK